MTFVPYLGFAALALIAIGFATFALRHAPKGRWVLGLAIGLLLLGVGGGTYWMVGQPQLATRAAAGLKTRDIRGLVPFLIARVRKAPDDLRAWTYLGRAYMGAEDPGEAAKAYARAVTLARLQKQSEPGLQAAYGEALVAASGGQVSDAAQKAFQGALRDNPKDPAARFFLGQARAERGDSKGALVLWQGLLAEAPASSPLHQALVDRIALLTAKQTGGGAGAPDPHAMVAALAAQLKANPHNAQGWQRLIRAYSVLGQTRDAKAALATARKTFAADTTVLAALNAQARQLKLD